MKFDIANIPFLVLFLLGGTFVRQAQAANFCNAYDPNFLGDVTEPTEGNAHLATDQIAEEMSSGLAYSANLLGLIPGLGAVSVIVGTASDVFQDQNSKDATAALVAYVDAVNTANKISDLETDWNTTLSNLLSAMESIDDEGESPDDTKLITAAGLCHDFFGYSGDGSSWGGKLGETSVDYSVFGATQRLLYAPSMCNQCLALHSTRYVTYNKQYESTADAIGKPAAAGIKSKRDASIEDLRYTAGRCLMDVMPMAMDAVQEQGDAAKDYEQKPVGFTTRTYAGVDEYNGGRYFEYDFEACGSWDDIYLYFDQCQADMHKSLGDWWMEWYRERLFSFQREWAYLSAFASPNGLVMFDPPTATFDLDRTYTIMNEAYGAFLNPTPYYAVNVLDYDTDKPSATTDPLDQIGTITNSKDSGYYLQEQTIPIGWNDVPGFAIIDKATNRPLCVMDDLAYFMDDTASNKESWCVWQFENVELPDDSTITSFGDSTYDATTVYIKNIEGTYLTADTTFLTLWEPFGIAVEGSDSPSEYATWRIFHTPDFATADYGQIFECNDSDDCDSSQICDSAAHFCTDPPELAVGEMCESDGECESGVCQSLTYSADRCASSSEAGSILTICENDDYSDGAQCDTGLTCSMETPTYGLCKKPDYEVNCYGEDDYCASGICNTLLSVTACDAFEPMSHGALCESDDHCDGILVCGSDGFCGYGGEVLVLSQMVATAEEHQAAAEACGGNLVSITDEDTNIAVKALMAKYGLTESGDYAFIGLKKTYQNPWTWRDGSDYTYSTWSPNGSMPSISNTKPYNAYLFCVKDELEYCEWIPGLYYFNYRGIYSLPEGYEQIDGCSEMSLNV